PGPRRSCPPSAGWVSIRRTASAPQMPTSASRWASIISAPRPCAARAMAAPARRSRSRSASTRRRGRRKTKRALPVGHRPRYIGPGKYEGRSSTMTYCCGILVRDGLVMFADTRTNAGVDNIATFRKLHVLVQPGQRIMAVASAGNLSISQSVVSILREGWENPDTGEHETLMNAPTMFQAAQRAGRVIRQLYDEEGKALEASDVKFDVSFLLGGQIKGERPR